METQLTSLGLSPAQAKIYLYLLKQASPKKPARIADDLKLTRTNTYKLLDSLLELGLVLRNQEKATLTYTAEGPGALTNLSQRQRNEAIRLEKEVQQIIPKLKEVQVKTQQGTEVVSQRGGRAIFDAHMRHARNPGDLHFILSQSDIPFMSYDNMRKIRHAPFDAGHKRYGITQDVVGAPSNPEIDARTGLTRTWINAHDYTAPVEWSVHGGELLIIDYSGEGTVVRIRNQTIAEAFEQVWQLLDTRIRQDPAYNQLPSKARRNT